MATGTADNLIPLALANGTFEAGPRRIWSTVYSYNRPDVTEADVAQMLAEFERVKLLFRWIDSASGKVWGYWIGIEKPGRLPGKSRWGTNEAIGPEPPTQELRKFLESNGIQKFPDGNEKLLGFGSCLGFGMSEATDASDERKATTKSQPGGFNATDVAQILCQNNGWTGQRMIWSLHGAIEHQAKRMPESTVEQVGEWLVKAWHEHKGDAGKYAGSAQAFFEEAKYKQADAADSGAVVVPESHKIKQRLAQEAKEFEHTGGSR